MKNIKSKISSKTQDIQNMERKFKIILISLLISVFLGIFSLCLPVIWEPDKLYWIWGLTFSKSGGFDFLTIYRLFWSLASSMLLVLAIYALIQNIRYISSIAGKKETNIIKFWLAWVLIGVTLIFTAILYFQLYPNVILGVSYQNAIEFPFFIYISGSIMIVTGILIRIIYSLEPSLIE